MILGWQLLAANHTSAVTESEIISASGRKIEECDPSPG